MSLKPETKFRMKFRAHLDNVPNSWFESIQQKTIHGTPDLLGCVNGRFVAIELKADKGVLSPLQSLKLARIAAAGGLGLVVDPSNWVETISLLMELAKENNAENIVEENERNGVQSSVGESEQQPKG